MNSMRDLLESVFKFAGEPDQKPGDQVRGSEPVPRKGGYKKHPFSGRLVGGGAEESVDPAQQERTFEEIFREEYQRFVAEYGAPGSAIGIKQQGADPQQFAAAQQEKKAQQSSVQNQIAELQAQVADARKQFAQLNSAFPQGASPVEKAMSLRDINAQRTQLSKQIGAQMQQIASLRGYLR